MQLACEPGAFLFLGSDQPAAEIVGGFFRKPLSSRASSIRETSPSLPLTHRVSQL